VTPTSYVLSRKAEEDVISIFQTGIEQFGLSQTERYHEQLGQCFCFLAENPLAAHERFEIFPPVRIHPIGSHLVIYRVEENGTVFIIRVRHGHEDWQNSLSTT
jgi:toxin ParE1/3/4